MTPIWKQVVEFYFLQYCILFRDTLETSDTLQRHFQTDVARAVRVCRSCRFPASPGQVEPVAPVAPAPKR